MLFSQYFATLQLQCLWKWESCIRIGRLFSFILVTLDMFGARSWDFEWRCTNRYFFSEIETYAGHVVPAVLDLSHLPILKYLTLTVDMLVSVSGTLVDESIPRWQWVIDTLNTCYQLAPFETSTSSCTPIAPTNPKFTIGELIRISDDSWTILDLR
ncbi:hypothetical protein BYT27DRAFT_7255220 [Phlegmacium glaucopus]|nr:hypothetical protein BYT27DRAFT_7255220 [Phlegmacium glaucopus]